MANQEAEKVLKTLKSALETNGGKEGKDCRKKGEKLYRRWIEEGSIAAPNGLPVDGEPAI